MRILVGLLGFGCLAASGQQANVTLTTSGTTVVLGQPVSLTATVTPSPAAGTVTFFDGVSVMGVRGTSGGQAVLTTQMFGPGPHALRAYFSGSWSEVMGLTVTATFANTLAGGGQFHFSAGVPFVAAGDFNGDGRTDFVALSGISLVVLLGNADGSFSAAANYAGSGVNAGCGGGLQWRREDGPRRERDWECALGEHLPGQRRRDVSEPDDFWGGSDLSRDRRF